MANPSTPERDRRPGRGRRSAALVLVLLPVLGLAGCGSAGTPVEKPETFVRAQPAELVSYAPQISLTGDIEARQEVALAFRTTGRMTARHAGVGDHVKSGELLATLDPEQQQADLSAARATVAAAKAEVDQTSAALDRQRSLLSGGVTTRSRFDQAKAAYENAKGSLDAAQAQLKSKQRALDHTRLEATVDGVVTQRNADVGEVVAAGQPVFVVARDGPRDAVFNVQESAFLERPDKETVTLALVGNPSVTATGHVREVSPSISATSGTVQVKVAIDDPPPQMTLGAAVTGTARGKSRKRVVLPASALWKIDSGPAVWVIDPKTHKVSLQTVEIGSYATDKVIIASGLETGELVVTEGGKLLHPGQIVTVEGGAP